MIVLAGSGWLSLVDGYPDGKLRVMERSWITLSMLIGSASCSLFLRVPIYFLSLSPSIPLEPKWTRVE